MLWSSGMTSRCGRASPGSIPGSAKYFSLFFFWSLSFCCLSRVVVLCNYNKTQQLGILDVTLHDNQWLFGWSGFKPNPWLGSIKCLFSFPVLFCLSVLSWSFNRTLMRLIKLWLNWYSGFAYQIFIFFTVKMVHAVACPTKWMFSAWAIITGPPSSV